MEGPSRELVRRLGEMGLCSPRELSRVQRAVGRLARGIPAFDSIWIDALVQAGKLTPFQARILESHQPERLRIGPCVLTDRLEEGGGRVIYRARRLDGPVRCLLTVHEPHADHLAAVCERLREVIERLRGLVGGVLAPPVGFDVDGGRIVLISEDVAGPSLRELLVQRGRLPADVVALLAGRLASGLLAAERRGVAHGDVRLRNIRLTGSWGVKLLQPGVAPALALEGHSADDWPLDVCDGLAPELSLGEPADSRSDQYALGCSLWQLLAGRPPFPSGDALGKLQAHRSRRVPDVRELAPETPVPLARLLARLTHSDRTQRFKSFADVHDHMGVLRRGSDRRLARFLRSPPSATLELSLDPRPHGRVAPRAAGAAALLLAVAAGALTAQGGRAVLLSISSETPRGAPGDPHAVSDETAGARAGDDQVPTGASDGNAGQAGSRLAPGVRGRPEAPSDDQIGRHSAARSDSRVASGPVEPKSPGDEGNVPASEGSSGSLSLSADGVLLPLPAPDAQGAVLLTASRDYAARPLEAPGSLRVRAAPGVRPRIIVTVEPWTLRGEVVEIEGIDVASGAGGDSAPLVSVHSQRLLIARCRITGRATPAPTPEGRRLPGDAIVWAPTDDGAPRGQIHVVESQFLEAGLACTSPPAAVSFEHVLCSGPQPRVRMLASGRPGGVLQMSFRRVSLRESGPLVEWRPTTPAAGPRMQIVAHACVFDLTPGAPLLRMQGAAPPQDWEHSVALEGADSVIRPDTPLLGLSSPRGRNDAVLDPDKLDAEGLLSGAFAFQGPEIDKPDDSVLRSTDTLLSAEQLPGLEPGRFPCSMRGQSAAHEGAPDDNPARR